MSVLGLLKKVKIQTLSFEKHPCRELDQEIMVHYLNGLALITNEDEIVCEREREYLSILINSFGLSEDMLEIFINFAENPDEKLILDMMQSFIKKDIKYNFIVDAMMIANIDGNFDEGEEAIIEQYFEMFKITKKEADDLKYIFEMFHTQDGNALFRYFKRSEYMEIDLFQYLLDYYKIDMAYELVEDEKKTLVVDFFNSTFKSGGLEDGAREIMVKPVNNAQFCIFLNKEYLAQKVELDSKGMVVKIKDNVLLLNPENSDIVFENGMFVVRSTEEDEAKVTGITYVGAEYFAKWLGEYDGDSYKLVCFKGSLIGINKFDMSKMANELCYAKTKSTPFSIKDHNNGYRKLELNTSMEETYLYIADEIIDDVFNEKGVSFRIMKSR